MKIMRCGRVNPWIFSTVAALVIGMAAPAGLAADPAPLVSVIVKLQDPPVATYGGTVRGLSATSPQVTGATRLDARGSAVQAYRGHLARQHAAFEAAATAAVPSARVLYRHQVVFGGATLLVPENEIASLSSVPGVIAVYRDRRLRLHTDRSPAFIGARNVWPQLGGARRAGQGVIVGVLDTGIWPEHPSLSDPDPSGRPYPAPPGSYGCDFPGGAGAGDPFACNNKLIGAYRFMARYDACASVDPVECPPDPFTSARDSDGHGTHIASTAAGNHQVAADIFDISRGLISGIAPGAHVIAYKVCGPAAEGGCFGSDAIAAIEQAIADGVDVINFSISGGENPFLDPVELAFRDAYAAGIFVAASGGNSGPTADTVEHRGPWVMTVGASTENRAFESVVTLTALGGATRNLQGSSITRGISNAAPLTLASSVGDEFCAQSSPAGTFAGKIVACRRGVVARLEKAFNVAQRGAIGMILYETTAGDTLTDNYVIPAVHLDADAGAVLLGFVERHAGVTAEFTRGRKVPEQGDRMAVFSSRGGPSPALIVLKPDVTAPGIQILAGNTPQPGDPAAAPGELFQAIAGTSMSSPHVAGAAALLKDLHPTWTPGQIKSALMTTARTSGLVKEDGVTPFTPFDAGSGRINLTRADDPGLTFDVPVADFIAHAGDLWNVNYPSVYLPGLTGEVTVVRTARSVLPVKSTWQLSVSGPPDLPVTVPSQIVVPAGGTTPIPSNLNTSLLGPGVARHATLALRNGTEYRLHLPITAVGAQPRPDLIVTAVTGSSPVTAGGTIDITATIENIGTAAAGSFTLFWYFSTDGQFSGDDVQFGDCILTSLAASGSFTCSFTNVAVPSSLAPGTYRLVAVVDIDQTVAESNEGNNENASDPVTVN